MIARYTRPEIARIWQNENRYRLWLKIEILVMEALARQGHIPAETLPLVRKRARLDPDRIDELERTLKHDVAAFVSQVAETIGEHARYLHWGLTSSDLLDTSFALLLVEAGDIIKKDILRLLEVLKEKAYKYKDLPMIGRTHGVHAEPISFGLKLALWYDETRRNLERLKAARKVIAFGKISGAVGTFAYLGPEVEAYVLKKLGLKPAPASSQIVQRDRHAQYFTTLAIIASSVEKFATEIRHLQRTEVAELEEFFSAGQQGSSAMPHKRNPITAERLTGLARLVRGYALAAMENVALWHERDISHSSVERVIAPDSTALVDHMLISMADLLDKMFVYPEQMRANLDKTRGLIFSQMLLLELMKKGQPRPQAYEAVQRLAMRAWQNKTDFRKLVRADRGLAKFLSRQEVEQCFDLNYHTKYVDDIFHRVFS
ncbi:MAG: adenylosuccinate lyase [Thermodesulfobacteriota bacterium]